MKVVISITYGGFGLSRAALHKLRSLGNPFALKETDAGEAYPDGGIRDDFGTYLRDIPRDDPQLVQVVEEMGREADGVHAQLKVIVIPDGIDWIVQDYDGQEWIAEAHRTWGAHMVPVNGIDNSMT